MISFLRGVFKRYSPEKNGHLAKESIIELWRVIPLSLYDNMTKEQTTFHFCMIVELKENKMIRQWTLSSKFYRYKEWEEPSV
jgi:hypothetical protein